MTNTTNNKRQRRMAREPKAQDAKVQAEATAQDIPETIDEVPASPKEPSKTGKVLSLLKRTEGATLDELVEATGWLPHTTRAALTGLRKKGHAIQRTKVDGVSRYGIAKVSPQ